MSNEVYQHDDIPSEAMQSIDASKPMSADDNKGSQEQTKESKPIPDSNSQNTEPIPDSAPSEPKEVPDQNTQESTESDRKTKSPTPPNTDNKGTSTKRLSPATKLFISKYIDKDSNTFSNATKSYMEAYPQVTENSASSESSRVLRKPQVQNYITRLSEEAGLTDKVAMVRLADIVDGISKVTTTTHTDPDGKVTGTSTVVSTPSDRDSIAAIELRNKMTGLYSQQEIDKAVTMDRYHERKRAMIKELQAGVDALDE